MVDEEKWRLKLERTVDNFCLFLKSNGIVSIKGKTGDYFIEIRSSTVFEIYSNRRGDMRIVFPPNVDKSERDKILYLWEEFRGNVHKGIEIYVDGSSRDGFVGYAAVIVDNGSIVEQLSGCSEDRNDLRNALGEIRAVELALEYCKNNNIRKVKIHYDYEGLRSWPLKLWRANNPLTVRYRDFVISLSAEMAIEWIKVDSHTGDSYNEIADKLARAALGDCLK